MEISLSSVYQECLSFLEKKDLRHALKRLDVLLQGSENWNLKNECEAVKGNYLLLLKYLLVSNRPQDFLPRYLKVHHWSGYMEMFY